ncbi:MAG: alanine--tRNA ligase [Desulfobacterales bacterium]|jgi:alanyl-tRNA synthetase
MTGNEARQTFLDYFAKHDHQTVRSSSLVPADDPTLLFTNAGMVQFKRTFLGEEKRSYNRAVTSQKCVRAGGKHNDLENVGYTARHHTFFEMLGNFSFGDYFKEKAIEFAWDLLTNGYGLPADKLWVSIYLDDDEAHDLWRKLVGVPKERIVRLGEEENFWAMGDTGPCGPCSEIHLDRGGDCTLNNPDCGVDCDCDRFLEIWNLVFMQFNRDVSGSMAPLPKPSIDTGLGLERIVSVLQDVSSNFDTDLIVPIIRRTEELAGRAVDESVEAGVAMKVIADHSRAAAFLIGDGVLPSNEGRGYVLRRIMRRAIRYGRNIGLTKPFLHDTARQVMTIMQPAYPELSEAEAYITSVIENEEVRFSETLDHGLRVLNEALEDLRARNERLVPGQIIFKLYDTFGFPVDIVRDVVRDEGMTLDMDGFDAAMDHQREQSRSVTAFTATSEAFRTLSAKGFKPEFKGYDALTADSRVLLLVKEGHEVASASAGDAVEIVAEATPFYGEAGGQAGDIGTIGAPAGDGLQVDVTETVKDPTGLIIHKGRIVTGQLGKGDPIRLSVSAAARQATARNHTATHILHAVLREVLGDHVKQAGSLVAPDRLRFDFSHFSPITPETIVDIEARVNARIQANVAAHTEEMDADQAFQSGATALFEEKYGDRVRVVSLADFSKELCGGTHVAQTGDIGLFKITGESSVAAGVRRIEALTGAAALAHIQKTEAMLLEAARRLKDAPLNVPHRIDKLLAEHRALEKEVAHLKSSLASRSVAEAQSDVRLVNGVKVLARMVNVDSPADLRDMVDRFRDKIVSGIVVLGAASGGKALLIVGVTADLTDRYHAGTIVKALSALVGGGGGGKADLAQAGGSQPEKLGDALAQACDLIGQQ